MSLPRVTLAALPTPLVRAHRLERALESGPVWVKRDDLTGFGVSGNKARALEFLIGDAVATDCDVLVAAGSPSSNFCAAAAMAARVAGLDCEVLYSGPAPRGAAANVDLAREAGALLRFDVVATRDELDEAVLAHAGRLSGLGRHPYPLPRGGATAVGAVGYALAAVELHEQSNALGFTPGAVVVATGSGATQAGLVAGSAGHELAWRVVGASVSRPPSQMARHVLELARECAKQLDLPGPAEASVEVEDLRGPGFGVASDEDRTSAELAFRYEGLLLDDSYGAKAMTLLRRLIRVGHPAPLVFWHTGGISTALGSLIHRGTS